MILPKPALTRPSTLIGSPNGRLPAHLLEPSGFGNALAAAPASRAFRAFVAVELTPRGIQPRHVGGYRDLAGQWRIFGGAERRYEPCSFAQWAVAASANRKTFRKSNRDAVRSLGLVVPDALYWRKIRLPDGRYPATAAEPGTSNHGDGLAIDVAEELDGDPTPESLSPVMLNLLITRGHLYGLGAEMDSEPWHWRYFAGDDIPAAVIRYENDVTPAPSGRPTITVGNRGQLVQLVQTIIEEKCGWDVGPLDGQFGPRTLAAWRAVCAWSQWTVDDVISEDDWDLLAWIDQGWARLNAAGVR